MKENPDPLPRANDPLDRLRSCAVRDAPVLELRS